MDIKIQEILYASKNGMPKNKIDPKGDGAGVRSLERGRKVTQAKIDRMYRNVLDYGKRIDPIIAFRLRVDIDKTLTVQEKRELIKEAVSSGFPRNQIEKNSHSLIGRLLNGQPMRDSTIHRLYDNLLTFLGYNIQEEKSQLQIKSAPERIRVLENLTFKSLKEINALKAEIVYLKILLQKQQKASTNPPKKRRKILGIPVRLCSSKSNGKTYKRWYGFPKNGKKIYIGSTLTNAEQKIRAGLLKQGIDS